jgi:hypothetical protein
VCLTLERPVISAVAHNVVWFRAFFGAEPVPFDLPGSSKKKEV